MPGDSEVIVHTAHEAAADRARILAEAMTLVRDLVDGAREACWWTWPGR